MANLTEKEIREQINNDTFDPSKLNKEERITWQRLVPKLTSEEMDKSFAAVIAANDASGLSYIDKLKAKVKRGETTEKFANIFDTVINTGKIGVALSQINQSKQSLEGLTPPTLPVTPNADPRLNAAIYQAQQGTFDTSRALAPISREIRNRRAAGEYAARQMAGGQQGTYGAANQLNQIAADKLTGDMGPIIDNIRAREQGRVDQLLNRSQQERQQNFQNRLGIYDRGMEQYNAQTSAAGALGSAGRQNLWEGIGGLGSNAAVMAGNISGNKYLDDMNRQANVNLNQSMDSGYTGGGWNPYVPNRGVGYGSYNTNIRNQRRGFTGPQTQEEMYPPAPQNFTL